MSRAAENKKRKKARQAAMQIGMCGQCTKRPVVPGLKRCKVCRAGARKSRPPLRQDGKPTLREERRNRRLRQRAAKTLTANPVFDLVTREDWDEIE